MTCNHENTTKSWRKGEFTRKMYKRNVYVGDAYKWYQVCGRCNNDIKFEIRVEKAQS
jgi:hypothetical protein